MIQHWKWKSLSCVRLSATPWTIYTLHGILQARILEWVTIPSSRGSSQPRDQTQVSHIATSLPAKPQGKPKNTGVGNLSLLQWIFLVQESNQGFLHCRWILYQLSHLGKPDTTRTHPSCVPPTKRASFNLITSKYPMNPNCETFYTIISRYSSVVSRAG